MANQFLSGNNPYQMQFVVQNSISTYTHEAYTNARKLSGTAIVGADARIDVSTEDYFGQMRWYKALTPVINVASVSDPTDGTPTEVTSAFAAYIKTVRTHGARQVNVQEVISKEDGLAKIGRDFGETQAQDEHNSVLETLSGVAAYEASRGAGIVDFTTNGDTGSVGFFVDILDANANFEGTKLIMDGATAATAGKNRGENLFRAVGMAWKDYEDDYFYMVTSPELLADLRSANLVDETIITEGNLQFNTIYNGKFRLILTRADQGDQSGSANVTGTKTTFIVKPNAMTMKPLSVPMPVEMGRDPAAYMGGGTTDIWYRWGYVAHPYGYDWAGSTVQFAQTAGTGGYDQAASWTRADQGYLNLGILPIFHT